MIVVVQLLWRMCWVCAPLCPSLDAVRLMLCRQGPHACRRFGVRLRSHLVVRLDLGAHVQHLLAPELRGGTLAIEDLPKFPGLFPLLTQWVASTRQK